MNRREQQEAFDTAAVGWFLGAVIACVLVAASCVASLAHAAEPKVTLDFGVGESRYTRAPAGTWQQPEFQNSVRTIDNVQSFGFTFPLSPRWSLGISYASLGSVAIDAEAVTCPRDDCEHTRDFSKDFNRPECKPAFNEDNCRYRWASGGNAKGMPIIASYRAFNMGSLGIDLRGGIFPHQLKYAAVVENIGCPDMPSCRQLVVTQRTHFTVRPVYGLGVKYAPEFAHGGYVGVTWDRFVGIGDRVKDMTAGFKGDTDRLMVWAGLPL